MEVRLRGEGKFLPAAVKGELRLRVVVKGVRNL